MYLIHLYLWTISLSAFAHCHIAGSHPPSLASSTAPSSLSRLSWAFRQADPVHAPIHSVGTQPALPALLTVR